MSKHDFSPEEFAHRLARTKRAIAQAGLDWFIAFHPVSIHWLTGSDGKSYQAFQCLFVPAGAGPTTIIARKGEECELQRDAFVDMVRPWGGAEPENPLDIFERCVDALGLRNARVGIEVPAYYLHPHHYLKIRDALGSALVAEPSNLIHDLKLVKSPTELLYVKEASRIADLGVAAFAATLERGRSELEVAGEVFKAILSAGSGQPASTLNLVSGERSAFSHGAPTDRRLELGDAGNVEFGAARRRYTVSIGRQFSIGVPSRRHSELFEIVKRAGDACIGAIRADVPAVEPHLAAKRVLEAAGLDRYRVHTTGYGLAPAFPPSWGEPVHLFGDSGYRLAEGMVLSVEPAVFIPEEKIGVRLIDNVVVQAGSAARLSRTPRELIVV